MLDPIARAERAAIAAARLANRHAGGAARARVADRYRLVEHHIEHARHWRDVSRRHARAARRERLERTVAWCAGETLS